MARHFRNWNVEEIDFLENNRELSISEMSRRLGITYYHVDRKMGELGLKKTGYEYWSEEDIEFLRKNFLTMGNKELAQRLNRSSGCIGNKAYLLGLSSQETKRKKTSNFFKGKHLSEEHKRKLSEARMGDKNPMYGRSRSQEEREAISVRCKKMWQDENHRERMSERFSGEKNPMFGRSPSQERRKMQSVEKKKIWQDEEFRAKLSGSNHWNWHGGKSFLPYPPEFNKQLKERIKERDNHTCQKCGSTERLSVHHIDYDKQNCGDDNLITLCMSCNISVNVQRVFWTGYFVGFQKRRSLEE